MTFEWPYLLLSLFVLPLLFALYYFAQRRRRAYAVRFTNLALLSEVVGRGPGLRRHVPPMLYLLGLTMLLVSVARPQAIIAVPREQTTVILVMDVSGSMAADDLRPNRMTAAKEAALAFVETLPPNIQTGLVSFGSTAHLRMEPTNDRDVVLQAIRRLQPNGGTAIGEGLHLALDQLLERPAQQDGSRSPAVVVLLSDGESGVGRPPMTATARALEEDVKVYTVGIGQRGVVTMLGGRQPVRLDETTLQAIATQTEGEYFYAAESGELTRIYEDLGSMISWVEERTEITALVSGAGALLFVAGALLGLRWFQQFP